MLDRLFDNFVRHVDVRGNTECWPWTGSTNQAGYGRFWVQGRAESAHRVAVAFDGRDPTGYYVCHSCDNPACVNPAHLWLGDAKLNAEDRDRKERRRRIGGALHGPAKLTEASVREIRESTETQEVLATRFGVSQVAVSKVKLRKTWRHVR